MKKFIVLVLSITIGLLSCSNPKSNNGENTNLTNVPDTAGYFAARNMTGIGNFKIGVTSYQEAYRILNEYKKNKLGSYYYIESAHAPNEIKYDTIESFLENNILGRKKFGCPDISEIESNEFKIGNIELNSIELKFYKDTLYEFKCNQNDKIEEGFKSKYGDGKFFDNTIKKGDKLLKIDEKFIWQNKTIITVSKTYHVYKYDGDKYMGGDYSKSNSYFEMKLKDPELYDKIRDCKNAAYETKKRLKEQIKQKNINQL